MISIPSCADVTLAVRSLTSSYSVVATGAAKFREGWPSAGRFLETSLLSSSSRWAFLLETISIASYNLPFILASPSSYKTIWSTLMSMFVRRASSNLSLSPSPWLTLILSTESSEYTLGLPGPRLSPSSTAKIAFRSYGAAAKVS